MESNSTFGLSDRQKQVLELVVEGFDRATIAQSLGITVSGVRWHINLLNKHYGTKNKLELIAKYYKTVYKSSSTHN